jgi:hypothetical protein
LGLAGKYQIISKLFYLGVAITGYLVIFRELRKYTGRAGLPAGLAQGGSKPDNWILLIFPLDSAFVPKFRCSVRVACRAFILPDKKAWAAPDAGLVFCKGLRIKYLPMLAF